MVDFNARSSDESTYQNTPVVDTTLELFLQELDILFSTERGDVLGNVTFGHSLEALLWSTTFDANTIRARINEEIKANCYMHEYFKYKVSLDFAKGISRDIGILTIDITNQESEESTKVTFIFK